MAEVVEQFYVCDCCGAKRIDPVRGNERGPTRYSIFVDEDFGVAGGRAINWGDLCSECHREAAKVASQLRKFQTQQREASKVQS
jgi:hypothetical protein